MGIAILVGYSEGHENEPDYEHAIMYCNTTEWAFGPVFNASKKQTAEETARGFLMWHDAKYGNPRKAMNDELGNRYIEYLRHVGDIER